MGWLERLPPGVKWLAFFGGFLLTAFASKLPEGLQSIGAYGGLILVIAAIIGAGLHWLKERRGGDKVESVDLIQLGSVGAVIFVAIAVAGVVWRLMSPPIPASAKLVKAVHPDVVAKPWKNTLEDLYVKAFPRLMSTEKKINLTVQKKSVGLDTTVDIRFRLYTDFEAHTDFVSIYVPTFKDGRLIDMTPDILMSIKNHIRQTRDEIRNSVGVGSSSPGTDMTWGRDLSFSGRVYVYTLNSLSVIQLGEIAKAYRDEGMFLEVRSTDFWTFHQND